MGGGRCVLSGEWAVGREWRVVYLKKAKITGTRISLYLNWVNVTGWLPFSLAAVLVVLVVSMRSRVA